MFVSWARKLVTFAMWRLAMLGMRRLVTLRLWRLRKDPHRPEVTLIEVLGKDRAKWTSDV